MLRREFLSLAVTAGISAEARPSVSRPTLADHRHNVIYRNEHGYAAWPTILHAGNGDLLIAFNEAMRRPTKMHADPTYLAMLIRSTDGGKTWSKPSPIGGYTNTGV